MLRKEHDKQKEQEQQDSHSEKKQEMTPNNGPKEEIIDRPSVEQEQKPQQQEQPQQQPPEDLVAKNQDKGIDNGPSANKKVIVFEDLLDEKPNKAQKILQGAHRYVMAVTPMTFFGTEVLPGDMPLPYSTVVSYIAPNFNDQVGQEIKALVTRQHPLNGLRAEGHGSALKGFVKEGGKFAVFGIGIPGSIGLGLGYLTRAYGLEMLNMLGSQGSQIAGMIALTPVIHDPVVGVISFGILYQGTKALFQCKFHPRSASVEQDPHIHPLQSAAKHIVGRAFEATVVFEFLRQALIVAGKEGVTQDPRFAALIIAVDQLMQAWGYLAYVPRPFDHLVPKNQWQVAKQGGYEALSMEEDQIQPQNRAPSAAMKTGSMGWYGARAAFVIGSVYALNWAWDQYLQSSMPPGQELSAEEAGLSNDPRARTPSRLGYQVLLVWSGVVTERIIEHGLPVMGRGLACMGRSLSNCSSALFNRWGSGHLRPQQQLENVVANTGVDQQPIVPTAPKLSRKSQS